SVVPNFGQRDLGTRLGPPGVDVDLPKVSVSDVLRLIQALSSAPCCKKEKGSSFYVSNYIDNYEEPHFQSVTCWPLLLLTVKCSNRDQELQTPSLILKGRQADLQRQISPEAYGPTHWVFSQATSISSTQIKLEFQHFLTISSPLVYLPDPQVRNVGYIPVCLYWDKTYLSGFWLAIADMLHYQQGSCET
ncbi:hypothetical protein XENOCAPTIV_007029, partial [Xenoophorus captivus]